MRSPGLRVRSAPSSSGLAPRRRVTWESRITLKSRRFYLQYGGVLIDFFLKLKSHKLPVSIKEYLTLLEAMDKNVIGPSIDEFYYLSRAALVKDEANYDKFDRAFARVLAGRGDHPRHRGARSRSSGC